MTITGVDPAAPLDATLEIGRALAARGLRFVHWKSNGHLAEALAGSTDVDIFADPAKRSEVAACLCEQGCLKVVSQPWAKYPDVEDWLTVDASTGRFLHLHLHFSLLTGLRRVKHLRIPWGEALLANTDHALDATWPTPAPEMELLILLVRMWAKMPPKRRMFAPRLPAHVCNELDWLLSRCDPARLRRLAADLLPRIDAEGIVALLGRPRAEGAVLAVSRRAYGELKSFYRMGWPLALVSSSWLGLRATAAKELRKLRPVTVTGKQVAGPGLLVAFIGIDGSGKSTLTREISKWLRYKLDVHFYYLGSGQGSTRVIDRLRHAARSKVKRNKSHRSGARGEQPARGFFARLAALHQLAAIRAKVRDLKDAHRLAAHGSIVVLDRFPQAQFPGIYDGPRLQNGNSFGWAARAEMAAFAAIQALQPHLIVKLVVSPEASHARKPDHNLVVLKRKAEITGKLAFPQSRVVEIDAGQPLEQVVLQAKQVVWSAMRERAAREVHGKYPA